MNEPTDDASPTAMVGGDPGTELSSNRTGLSFERTRMSADRTLMSVVRTSLSLIAFGFTINEVFSKASGLIVNASGTGRRLGLGLLIIGLVMLVMGIFSHARFGRELTCRRERLYEMSLLRRAIQYRATPTYVVAVLLLGIGLVTVGSVAFRMLKVADQ
jgi:putative membrane protein